MATMKSISRMDDIRSRGRLVEGGWVSLSISLLGGKEKVMRRSSPVVTINTGIIWAVYLRNGISHLCQMYRFWGLPMGVRLEPVLAARIWNIMILSRSFFRNL